MIFIHCRTIYKCQYANILMSALLHFVSRMTPVPQRMFGFSNNGSFVFGIAGNILKLLEHKCMLN